MREAFLHFIWKYQYFDKENLRTTEGTPINIVHPGYLNTDAGADFSDAKIIIDGIEWRGSIEIHVNATDWFQHGHQKDKNYNNVVLHVVWDSNGIATREDGTIIPAISLQGIIPERIIFEYKKLMNSPEHVPCENQIQKVKDLVVWSTLDKVVMERLILKSGKVLERLKINNQDWEETAYQLLAANFGFKINSEPFLILAESLPYKIIKKHINNRETVESLLFGQAGFLNEEFEDEYYKHLQGEYGFFKHKYGLNGRLDAVQWRKLRLRPANFPMVRLSQFAAMLCHVDSLFQNLLAVESARELYSFFKSEVSSYWTTRYHFGEASAKKAPSLGKTSVENIAINTVVPILVAYGKYIDDERYIARALALLQDLNAENNKIIKYWRSIGMPMSSSFDTQAYIQLYNNYCQKRRCLECNIGVSLIR